MADRRAFLAKVAAGGSALVGACLAGVAGVASVPRAAAAVKRWRKAASMFDIGKQPLMVVLADRHQDGWLTYMNLGHDAWRNHITGRIAETIERFGVDAYFLDIVGGHVNSTTGDMHEGTKRMVMDLREKFPKVACVGEMPYDALYQFIPMYHAGGGARWQKYAKFFSHLSAPAAGRGSSGVHEAGFQRFNAETLGLSATAIPTLQVVDDTFTAHRDVMAQVIARAKQRAGIG